MTASDTTTTLFGLGDFSMSDEPVADANPAAAAAEEEEEEEEEVEEDTAPPRSLPEIGAAAGDLIADTLAMVISMYQETRSEGKILVEEAVARITMHNEVVRLATRTRTDAAVGAIHAFGRAFESRMAKEPQGPYVMFYIKVAVAAVKARLGL